MSFADLHVAGAPFVLVNVWDKGTARLAAHMGAKALATTSAGHAFTLGRVDGEVAAGEAIAHAHDIVSATDLPVSIDFENGYGDTPEAVAGNVGCLRDLGAAGLSIEDWDGSAAYGPSEATDRLSAAIEAAGDMVVCARADGVMNGVYGMDEAVRRCAAFADAGADVLYVPVLPDLLALKDIVSLGKPVNGLAAGQWLDWTLDDWAKAGVARVSLGSTLSRCVQDAFVKALGPTLDHGHLPAMKHTAPPALTPPHRWYS